MQKEGDTGEFSFIDSYKTEMIPQEYGEYVLNMRKIIFPRLSEQFTQTTELLNINLYTNIQQIMYK